MSTISLVQTKRTQVFQVDGEPLSFTDFAKIEVIPGAIDLLMDFDTVMRESRMFL